MASAAENSMNMDQNDLRSVVKDAIVDEIERGGLEPLP
jgi:hypothetical protein